MTALSQVITYPQVTLDVCSFVVLHPSNIYGHIRTGTDL